MIVTFSKIFTGFSGHWTAKCRCYNLITNRISFSYVLLKTILKTLSTPFSSTQKHAWMSSPFLGGMVTLRSVLKSVPPIRLRLRPQTCTLNNFTLSERIGSFRWLLSNLCNFLLKSGRNNAHCTEKSGFFPACEIFIGEKSVSNRGCRERGEKYVRHLTLMRLRSILAFSFLKSSNKTLKNTAIWKRKHCYLPRFSNNTQINFLLIFQRIILICNIVAGNKRKLIVCLTVQSKALTI